MADEESKLKKLLSQSLRSAREAAGMTQQEAAEQIGISVEVYGRYERAKTLPSVRSLRLLAEALETSSDTLLGIGPTDRAKVHLSPEERRILRSVRRADKPRQRVIAATVELMAAAPKKKGK